MAEGLRQREGDQPLPVGNDLPSMHDVAADELAKRRELGISRYGQPLQPANGRNAALDAYEEALDGAAYGAQVLWEQQHPEHTYVGALIEAIASTEDETIVSFGDCFVPQSVYDLLDHFEINYTLPPVKTA